MLERYGVKSPLCRGKLREKGLQTKLEKHGDKNFNNSEKTTKTCIERYGTGRNNQKAEATMMKKYGVKSYLSSPEVDAMRNSPEIQAKIQETKRKHSTFNKSSLEEQACQFLLSKFKEVKRQFSSEKYPFNCDFYIPEKDLYVECNFHWTHGFHPFDETNKEDLKRLELMKSKKSKFYDTAIIVWTVKDPEKRKTAKQNGIALKEFWTLEELEEYFNRKETAC